MPQSPTKKEFYKAKGVEETTICFTKIQSEKMKMTWRISLFIFYMTCNFSKCDGFIICE